MEQAYSSAIDWLFKQFPSYQNKGASAYKPDLYNVNKLCDLFDNPQNKLKFIHIAGTNGKGSTCSYIASCLTEANFKTGLFTSPHILDFTERIRINGSTVSKEFVIEFVQKVQNSNLDYSPSFFEITWVMALTYFERESCDICVIETGLGGRLDATNIIQPLISVITNIGIDHVQFLGDTFELIAFEKAGIIKEETPVVIGEWNNKTQPVFQQVAQRKSSKLVKVDLSAECSEKGFLKNSTQLKNWLTAKRTLLELPQDFQINPDNFQKGIDNLYKNTGLRGRIQVISENPRVIFDAGHNPDGIENLIQEIQQNLKGKLHIVYGTSNDKDINSIFHLFPTNVHYYFTQFKNERSVKIEVLERASKNYNLKALFYSKATEALTEAQNTANEHDTILVFGSFFLLNDLF